MVSVLYLSERPEITPHDEEPNKAKTTKGNIESTKGEKMNLKKLMQFNNPPRKIKNNMTKAGYIVTLQQVGPNVVATGSGAINLHGLTFSQSASPSNPGIIPRLYGAWGGGGIWTGPTSSSVDSYRGPSGPWGFGSGGSTLASSGSGDMVGIFTILLDGVLYVPRGYVSGTFLSGSATYSGKTFATLGVTPGTYVWTWGTGANQNFTLQIPVPPPPPVTGPPVAITNPATLIASFAANLNGSVNPHGLTTRPLTISES